MTEEPQDNVAIIVAMTDPAMTDFADQLACFSEEAGPLGEVFVMDASGGLSFEWLAKRHPNVRVLYRPIGQLAPQLWRDGLMKSTAPLVAFTTAQMRLMPGWRVALIDRLRETDASGVGGPIAPGLKLPGVDRAVALLRYSRYFPPLPQSKPVEPPGDNALYRRDRLMGVESSWADGFWEVEVNQALRDRGETLAMSGSAVATFEGGLNWGSMARQRVRHAKKFGASRSKSISVFTRLLKVFASPLVPPLLWLRAYWNLRSRKMRILPWITAGPGLMILASAWAFGEAIGTWQGPVAPVKPRRTPGKKSR